MSKYTKGIGGSPVHICPVCSGEMAVRIRIADQGIFECVNYPCKAKVWVEYGPIDVKIMHCSGTKIHYMYRDGGNWKKHNTFEVTGYLDLAKLQEYCDSDDTFIPGDVGWPSLSPYDETEPTEDDHPWHEITNVELLQFEPENAPTAEEVMAAFRLASELGWQGQYE